MIAEQRVSESHERLARHPAVADVEPLPEPQVAETERPEAEAGHEWFDHGSVQARSARGPKSKIGCASAGNDAARVKGTQRCGSEYEPAKQ